MKPLSEARQILKLTGGDPLKALELVERQLNLVFTRSQVLLTLSGALLTITGFSGRAIADAGALPRALLVLGLVCALFSAIWIFRHAMSIRWVSSDFDDRDAILVLADVLARRNVKSRAYRFGGLVFCAGLLLYGAALILMVTSRP